MENKIENILKKKNIKATTMRMLIYEILQKNKKALSLYEIEQQFDNADRTTIYRTLKTFQDNYLIHSIDDGTGAVKYALCDEGCTCGPDDLHLHFLCTKCGQTYCLRETPVPKMDLPEGFTYESANFVIKGICSSCQK